MNNTFLFLKSKIGKTILILLLLIASFYGGMEYKAYQIRSTMAEVFSGVSDALSGNTKSEEKEKPKASNDLTKKVSFEIIKKGFSSSNYDDSITFTFQLKNNTEKDMEGVEGIITMMDIFGNTIQNISLSYDEGLKAGEVKLYSASVDYNQFMEKDMKLKGTELEKLKYDWQVTKIVYQDGSIESY